ncbi:DUF2290 domain-containing protein [Burkholderia thailandensis]|uniref:DUF2290 domain-containing protein n=1 Tax=Burkholderia thailandensis TaxID=57975 RepID=UPI0003ECAD04|nr:DUF2290 domain-containing protein [Burkholderia thailandensis]AHI63367.1 hypothetical protein BTL_3214 [Burkholderia thailandensis H0587]AVR24328.1 DUF2290 domain-containing protein [Burkholderia thailandensis]
MNEKAFTLSLRDAHGFFSRELGLAEPLAGPTSLPARSDFNRIALDTERPYTDVFFAGLKVGQYNFALTDFSYFQFSYTSEEDVRYAFYPSPFTTDALASIAQLQQRLGARDAADVEMLMTFAESQPVNYRRPVVRYEYNVEQYDAGVHPVSHLHIGTYGDDRWVLQPRLTPLAFALVIAKLYFRPHWEAVTEGEGEKRLNEFDRLLEKEREVCEPTPEDKFAHETKAFYMA